MIFENTYNFIGGLYQKVYRTLIVCRKSRYLLHLRDKPSTVIIDVPRATADLGMTVPSKHRLRPALAVREMALFDD